MLGRLIGVMRQGRGRIIAACAAVAVGLTAFAVGHAATETAALIKVRMGGDSAETRLVIDLDGATSAKIVSDGAADRRVVIMLPNVIAGQTQQGAGKGIVRAWMVDQVQGGARTMPRPEPCWVWPAMTLGSMITTRRSAAPSDTI